MTKVIAFINMKGGVGKTTLAVNIAHTISKEFNKKVLVIDMDPQMNATQYSLSESKVNSILKDKGKSSYAFLSPEYNTNSVLEDINPIDINHFIFKLENSFDIIPSSMNIMNINLSATPFKLNQFIQDNLKNLYDIIIIDCPPTISDYTKASLLASDYYIVPMKTDPFSLFGLPILEKYINLTIVKEFNHNIFFLGIILNKVYVNKVLYKKYKPEIEKKWSGKLLVNELKQCEDITKSIENEEPQDRFITNLKNEEIKEQLINITKEIMQKGRLL